MRPPSLSDRYREERSRRLKAEREARELRAIVRDQTREIRTLRRDLFYMRTDRHAITEGVSPWVHLPYYGVVS